MALLTLDASVARVTDGSALGYFTTPPSPSTSNTKHDVDGAEIPWKIHHVGNAAETRSLPWMQVVSRSAWRALGCVTVKIRAHLGGRRVDQGSAEAVKDAGQASSRFSNKNDSSSGKFLISG